MLRETRIPISIDLRKMTGELRRGMRSITVDGVTLPLERGGNNRLGMRCASCEALVQQLYRFAGDLICRACLPNVDASGLAAMAEFWERERAMRQTQRSSPNVKSCKDGNMDL